MTDTITVGGLPGTGTTTVCGILKDRLGLRHVYAGQVFRDEAKRRGLSLEEFGTLCETDPRVDTDLDRRQVEYLKEDGLILEGRLSGWLAHREHIPALKVWLTCKETVRVQRLVDRDGGSMAEQIHMTRKREQSETERYQRYYGIDLADLAPYDLVLDTTDQTPEQLADRIAEAAKEA